MSREFAVDFLRKLGLYYDFKIKGDNFNGNLLSLLRKYQEETIKNKECTHPFKSVRKINEDVYHCSCCDKFI